LPQSCNADRLFELPGHDRDALRVLRLHRGDLLQLADDSLMKHRISGTRGGNAAVYDPCVWFDPGAPKIGLQLTPAADCKSEHLITDLVTAR
jgi:hypothetical protein